MPFGTRGAERVEFRLAANPGEPLGALSQVAAGGELSRVMLALHVAVEGQGARRVLVFDEVDSGVGGAVADAVGARLARLARRQQVLCVTHLPQVAAYADSHFRVHKQVSDGRTRAHVAPLDGERRVEELARMLAGKHPTATSLRHAAELLSAAGRTEAPAPRRRA
jgi:DNA repair protein RecN (Recombination protein N)